VELSCPPIHVPGNAYSLPSGASKVEPPSVLPHPHENARPTAVAPWCVVALSAPAPLLLLLLPRRAWLTRSGRWLLDPCWEDNARAIRPEAQLRRRVVRIHRVPRYTHRDVSRGGGIGRWMRISARIHFVPCVVCAEGDARERKNRFARVDPCARDGPLRGGVRRVNLRYSGLVKMNFEIYNIETSRLWLNFVRT
jgi:hypothetical protein